MYIVELLIKLMNKKKEPPPLKVENPEEEYNAEKCEHLFYPIDSTKKVLACSKCGLVVKASEVIKKKNFFEQ